MRHVKLTQNGALKFRQKEGREGGALIKKLSLTIHPLTAHLHVYTFPNPGRTMTTIIPRTLRAGARAAQPQVAQASSNSNVLLVVDEVDPLDVRVAKGCYTLRQLQKFHKQDLKDPSKPPKGCLQAVEWGDKYEALHQYGTLVLKEPKRTNKRKKSGAAEVEEEGPCWHFQCNIDPTCRREGTTIKLGGGDIDKLCTSNGARHMRTQHGIRTDTGAAREEARDAVEQAVVVSQNSALRAANPQRYFELDLTDGLFIGNYLPFNLSTKREWRISITGMQQQARAGLPPEMTAQLANTPIFKATAFYPEKIKVRFICLC